MNYTSLIYEFSSNSLEFLKLTFWNAYHCLLGSVGFYNNIYIFFSHSRIPHMNSTHKVVTNSHGCEFRIYAWHWKIRNIRDLLAKHGSHWNQNISTQAISKFYSECTKTLTDKFVCVIHSDMCGYSLMVRWKFVQITCKWYKNRRILCA